MKRFEEKEGKVYIDGVEYIKKEQKKERFMSIDTDLITLLCDKLAAGYVVGSININGVSRSFGQKEMNAIRKLAMIGLTQARKDQEKLGKFSYLYNDCDE